MATRAYAKKTFEDDFVVAYAFGQRPSEWMGEFVISKADPTDWHVFTSSDRRREAEVTYMKGFRQFRDTGQWPPGVSYNS